MTTRTLNLMLWNREWMTLEQSCRLYANLCEVLKNPGMGDVVEMGSHHGGSACLIADALKDLEWDGMKKLHVFDSFQGFPKPSEHDSETYKGGELAIEKSSLIWNFSVNNLTLPIIHEGFFCDTAKEMPEQICFANLDSDLYQSILDSLTAVYPRLSSGGRIVIHDYADPRFPGVEKACSEFFTTDCLEKHQGQAVFTMP